MNENHKSKVALVYCDSYDENRLYSAVKQGIDLLGGFEQYINPNDKVLLKPNILVGDPPAKASATHPQVFRAVARLLLETHPNVAYGDSPAIGSCGQMKRAGFHKIGTELGLHLADFDQGQDVKFPDSPFTKSFKIANGVLESDALISISKLKTHQLSRITGAVKNQFGCIPGLLKTEYHLWIPNAYDFCKMLVTLNLLIQPKLYIMDGITAMQGNGPRGGEPVPMNTLLFSNDPIALDATAARLVALNPEHVTTSGPGEEWGLGTWKKDQIELLGHPFDALYNPDFDIPRKPVSSVTRTGRISFIKNWISPRPVIDSERCVRCGMCVRACPVSPKAVDWQDDDKKPPLYNYKRCIRCFCCQEICPEQAITVRTPWLGRLLFRR
ncbi:MAG: DUF362 domain-containing protein [candidate division KSB1 bacterium]|nr:DUF362 domain-containing protein [candidate division KSB1 bacterium]